MATATAPVVVDLSQKKALTLDEAAAVMNISRSQIERLQATGQLQVVKIGRRILVRPWAIDAYLDALGQDPPAPSSRGGGVGGVVGGWRGFPRGWWGSGAGGLGEPRGTRHLNLCGKLLAQPIEPW